MVTVKHKTTQEKLGKQKNSPVAVTEAEIGGSGVILKEFSTDKKLHASFFAHFFDKKNFTANGQG